MEKNKESEHETCPILPSDASASGGHNIVILLVGVFTVRNCLEICLGMSITLCLS